MLQRPPLLPKCARCRQNALASEDLALRRCTQAEVGVRKYSANHTVIRIVGWPPIYEDVGNLTKRNLLKGQNAQRLPGIESDRTAVNSD